MEILDAPMLKQNPAKFQKRLRDVQKRLLLRAMFDRNFLNNPKKVGELVAKTMYSDDDRDINLILIVSIFRCIREKRLTSFCYLFVTRCSVIFWLNSSNL